jgi:hypothetical protein
VQEKKTKSKSHYDRRSVSQSVSQSVCLGVKPKSGTFDHRFFSKVRSCLCGTPSLTRGRVSKLSSVFVNIVIQHLHKSFTLKICILCYTHFSDLHYLQRSVSPGLVQQIMPYLLLAYSTNGSLCKKIRCTSQL